MKLGKYSFGIGDRFGKQGVAQLTAIMKAKDAGIDITPVWNKSNREHTTIGTEPAQTRAKADKAVKACNWQGDYFVDADHINLDTVDKFLPHADFFTLDVADFIGKKADTKDIADFVAKNKKYTGELKIPGLGKGFKVSENDLQEIAKKFLFAAQQAGRIYRHIEKNKGQGNFITEVSMDEVDAPQSPAEMFFILQALAQEKIPVQTIAPKFSGRFNKGVDYVGDTELFELEFEADLLVIDFAVKEFSLPEDLKLSVHSGSDKFSIYPIIGKLLRKHDKGIHVKTAGTTWLEEVIGLALAGNEGREIVKMIYSKALSKIDQLSAPYASVIDIDKSKLPPEKDVKNWSCQKFANTLRHVPENPEYNKHFRQLIHVAYKVAAEMGATYTNALSQYAEIVGKQVTENIFERHIKRLFEIN